MAVYNHNKQLPIPSISPLEVYFGTMAREDVFVQMPLLLIVLEILSGMKWFKQFTRHLKLTNHIHLRRQEHPFLMDVIGVLKKNQLINVIATNSRGAMFMYCDVFNGMNKTRQEIGDFFLDAIEKIGPSNVHKHIFWSLCVCHTLNLIFKDFPEALPYMKST
ncbi:hypothetical protein GQ457_17G011950 [Hibiscus cannabinus]